MFIGWCQCTIDFRLLIFDHGHCCCSPLTPCDLNKFSGSQAASHKLNQCWLAVMPCRSPDVLSMGHTELTLAMKLQHGTHSFLLSMTLLHVIQSDMMWIQFVFWFQLQLQLCVLLVFKDITSLVHTTECALSFIGDLSLCKFNMYSTCCYVNV